MKKKAILFILFLVGLVMAIVANWPSIVHAYFPATLPFALIGGGMIGGFGAKLILG